MSTITLDQLAAEFQEFKAQRVPKSDLAERVSSTLSLTIAAITIASSLIAVAFYLSNLSTRVQTLEQNLTELKSDTNGRFNRTDDKLDQIIRQLPKQP